MTSLKKTIIIEANREDSVEVKDYGTNTQLASKNKAEWTNLLRNCNLKKGDILSFDSACINSKGSNPDAIEFDGQNVSENRKYTDNFMIMKFGRYINNNLEYAVGLPCFDTEGASSAQIIASNPFKTQADGYTTENPNLINVYYGIVSPDLIPTNAFQIPFLFDSASVGGQAYLVSPELLISANYFTRLNNNKYALINRFYRGHNRLTMDAPSWNANMSVSEFKIKMDPGFQNPSNLSSRITAILHQTNVEDDYLNHFDFDLN